MPDQYPQWAAGDEITAEKLMEMIPRIITKPTPTQRPSTTTFSDDPDLSMEVEANATYFVEFHIYFGAVDAAKIKTAWTVPVGTTGFRCVIGPGSSVNNSTIDNVTGRFGGHAFSTAVVYGTRDSNSNVVYALETATVITGSSGGTLALRWAQNVSNATPTQVFASSLMRVTRLR